MAHLAPVPEAPAPPVPDPAQGAREWRDALSAIAIFAALPAPVAMVVRARAGAARDAFLVALARTCGPARRIPANVDREALTGGPDMAASLAAGSMVRRAGLLTAPDPVFVIAGAERLATDAAGALQDWLDAGEGRLVILDEGEDDGAEAIPAGLFDRAALHLRLEHASLGDRALVAVPQIVEIGLADPDDDDRLVSLASGMAIASLRPVVHARRVLPLARTLCKDDEDAWALTARLSLVAHATAWPQPQEPSPPPPEQSEPAEGDDTPTSRADGLPDEMLLEAIAAGLPPGVLEGLRKGVRRPRRAGRKGVGGGLGERGRPLPSRRGSLRDRATIDVPATLRAAVPWQRLRGREPGQRLAIRADDIRLKRRRPPTATSVIFAVDASGSTALSRLAEAKGAVEQLLSEGYARRDRVALVAFRKDGAEVLLPPTRALARAKRALSGLPGGGGTPLASGMEAARQLAADEVLRGRTVTLVLLTDGSANVDMAGKGGRARATAQAEGVARAMALEAFEPVLIDVGGRPSIRARDLARAMDGAYVPMPAANASALGDAVRRHAPSTGP